MSKPVDRDYGLVKINLFGQVVVRIIVRLCRLPYKVSRPPLLLLTKLLIIHVHGEEKRFFSGRQISQLIFEAVRSDRNLAKAMLFSKYTWNAGLYEKAPRFDPYHIGHGCWLGYLRNYRSYSRFGNYVEFSGVLPTAIYGKFGHQTNCVGLSALVPPLDWGGGGDSLEIGSDVWVGSSAQIMPNCQKIGTGAVIAAGAIVTKDVPPFAVVAGNPARVVKYRFTESERAALLKSRWWELTPDQLGNLRSETNVPRFLEALAARKREIGLT